MKVTLNEIRSYGPCPNRLRYGLQHADPRPADDEPFPVSRVLETNGLSDTLWLLGRKGEQQLLVRFACGCAERVVGPYWEPDYPGDRRPQRAIAAARRWVDNPTEENRARVHAAAQAAEAAARAAADRVAHIAAHAARIAAAAARAAYYAAAAAARAAYYAAAAVEDAAHAAVAAVAFAAALAAAAEERTWQIDRLRKILEGA